MVKKLILIIALVTILSGCSIPVLKPDNDKFTLAVKKLISEKRKQPVLTEIQGKPSRIGAGYSTIHIKNVALEDFIRVVFSEALKYPYVLDLDVVNLQKRIDVEILSRYTRAELFSVVLAILEKSGCEVEDIEGVLVISLRPGGTGLNGGYDNQGQGGKKEKELPLANVIYSYQPLYARAIDLQKSIRELITSDQSRVILHEANNSLIIKSTAQEKRSVARLLRILDQRQKQIGVDVTIAEVTLSGDLSMGLEAFFHSGLVDIKTGPVPNNGLGITANLFVSDFVKAVIQMGEKQGLITIKSNPYLLISDGSKSTIAVGSEYPIMTSQKTAQGEDTAIYNEIEYRKTGIILSLLPIVSGGDVHLTSIIELSEGQKNEISSIDSPAILTRRIESAVIMESGQTLIVGGLISEIQDKNNTFFPGVKGRGLLTGKAEVKHRTELVIILNVAVINEKNVEDWFKVISEKYENQKIYQ